MVSHATKYAALVLALAACGGGERRSPGSSTGAAAGAAALTGAGATFPNPIYAKWFDSYRKLTGIRINYQSIGSGAGIRQFTEGTVDFGATDAPMSDAQIAAVHGDVLHVPTVLGAVVATYNLRGLNSAPLRFDGRALADIFSGRISRWNDTRIAALNPGVALPPMDIIVVHRSDGSGTTYIFTEYLAKSSPEWGTQVGHATSVNWPIGLGGKGNEGVTQLVQQSEGAIGYVELTYALSNHLPAAEIRNASGQFVAPELKSVTAAAAAVTLDSAADFRISITNPPGAGSYPIASFTWLLIRPQLADSGKARAMKGFLAWMLQPDAQRMAADLHYAPMPARLIELLQRRLGAP